MGATWSVKRLGSRFRGDAGAVVLSIAGGHAAVAVLGSALLPRSAAVDAAPWAAMVGAGVVAGLAAAVAVVRVCGIPPELAARVPSWVVPGLRAAAVALVALLFAGALALLAAFTLGAPSVAGAYGTLAPGVGSGFGVTLLVLAYLPNAVIGGMSWVLGPGVSVGTGTASPFGAIPPAGHSSFPLLAAVPTATPPVWTLVALCLPVLAGVLAGSVCRRTVAVAVRVPAAAVAIGATTLGAGVLAALAGGRLAAGAFDPIRMPPGLVMASVLLLVGVPALLTSGLTRRGDGADTVWDDAPEPADDAAEPKPRTVAELVALRERQAASAPGPADVGEAGETSDGAGPADGAADGALSEGGPTSGRSTSGSGGSTSAGSGSAGSGSGEVASDGASDHGSASGGSGVDGSVSGSSGAGSADPSEEAPAEAEPDAVDRAAEPVSAEERGADVVQLHDRVRRGRRPSS
jgi:hypothetical protein